VLLLGVLFVVNWEAMVLIVGGGGINRFETAKESISRLKTAKENHSDTAATASSPPASPLLVIGGDSGVKHNIGFLQIWQQTHPPVSFKAEYQGRVWHTASSATYKFWLTVSKRWGRILQR
jgi:hypothetical protein